MEGGDDERKSKGRGKRREGGKEGREGRGGRREGGKEGEGEKRERREERREGREGEGHDRGKGKDGGKGGTNFRQQAVSTVNLVLEAASRMESISDTTFSSTCRNQPRNSHTHNHHPTPVGTPSICSAGCFELNNLFK